MDDADATAMVVKCNKKMKDGDGFKVVLALDVVCVVARDFAPSCRIKGGQWNVMTIVGSGSNVAADPK